MAQSLTRVRFTDSDRAKFALDGLENFMTGMGMSFDKTMFTRWGAGTVVIDRAQLEMGYRTDWIARKVVDIPAWDATRNWRSWQASDTQIEQIEAVEKKLRIKSKVKQALTKARLYGGAALVMGVDDGQSPDKELDLERVTTDSLKFVHVVSRHELTTGQLDYDIMSQYYGMPSYYESMGQGTAAQVRLHPSRVVRFIGLEMPDPMRQNDGWGDPVLQIVADAVKACGTVSQSVAQLVSELKVDVIKVPELTANMMTAEQEEKLKRRFGMAASAKSIYNMLLLDREEEWQRIQTNLAGLPDLVKVYLMIASGAADIPATRFVGQSPQGLNATGDSDTRNYYDRVKHEQENEISPALEMLDEVIIRSATGSRDENIWYEWNSLWQMTPEQLAELSLKKAQTFQIDANAGLMNPAVLKEARQAQLIEDGFYPGLENILDELDDEADLLTRGIIPDPDEDPNDDPNDPNNDPNNDPDTDTQTTDAKRKKKKSLARVKLKHPRDLSPGRRGMFANTRNGPRVPMKLFASDAAIWKTMYVYRPLLNAKEVLDHFRAQGLKPTMRAGALHVTIAHSNKLVDWTQVGEAFGQDSDGTLVVPAGGMRAFEKFGDAREAAYVLLFQSSDLAARHHMLRYAGAEWKWSDYQPHVTIAWRTLVGPNGQPMEPAIDTATIQPYRGKLIFGPEVFEEVNDNWREGVIQDAMWK